MLTDAHRVAVALVVAVCLAALAMLGAAWPASGAAPHPTVTPATYGPPGPNGGAYGRPLPDVQP